MMQVGETAQELVESQLTITCKLAGPQHSEIGFPIYTDNASWRGPNIVKLNPQFLQTMQVGETGQNTEAGGKSPYNNVRVGGAPTQKLAESQLL